jgi:A/G-specific adenine glycosylase
MENATEIAKDLMRWYDQNKRDLPWRKTQNPYHVWLSEIILQQTRVEQGREYYLKFVDKFPDILSLSIAEESEILKIWQGLGYYARARNMHFAAKQMVDLHKGNFPNDYLAIKNLRGIGDYTAAAIASFAFKQHYPAIDGNVKRVTARFYGIDLPISSTAFYKLVEKELFQAINTTEPDIFNQAMIELGAILCTPLNPKCEICPIQTECTRSN